MSTSPPLVSCRTTPPLTGAQLIAHTLQALDIKIVFGIVGIPIIEVAEACIAIGIKFVGFRNEQAASYAASAYGYLTRKPGVLLVVGGPGVVHALAGVHSSQINHFPLLMLSGASPSTHLPTKGSFQALQTTTFLSPHTKIALRAPTPVQLPQVIREAYKIAFWGRPGAAAVEINGDFVTHKIDSEQLDNLMEGDKILVKKVPTGPQVLGDPRLVAQVARILKTEAKKPLLVIGKGAAYARSEGVLKKFVEQTSVPFLPTPMGKGLLPDDHPRNASSSRSLALAQSDLIILLGARLNWILHFGAPPKFLPNVRVVKIDISQEELGRNLDIPGAGNGATGEELGIAGDCTAVLEQLLAELADWKGLATPESPSPWLQQLNENKVSNAKSLEQKLNAPTPNGMKLSYERTFYILNTLFSSLTHSRYPRGLNAVDDLVYVSEGANTMDKSRSIFSISQPRSRLDAGADATMGIGTGYAIAAWCAYNLGLDLPSKRKKVIAIEGDSAFGFSAMEIETMSRYNMDIIIVVVNNGGVYRGENYGKSELFDVSPESFSKCSVFEEESKIWNEDTRRKEMALPSTALSYGTRYDHLADSLGGKGFRVWGVGDGSDLKTGVEKQLVDNVKAAWEYSEKYHRPVLIDIGIESGKSGELEFKWMSAEKAETSMKQAKL